MANNLRSISFSSSSSKSSLHDSSSNLPSIHKPVTPSQRTVIPTFMIDSSKIRPLSRSNRTSSGEITPQNEESTTQALPISQTAVLGSNSTMSLPNRARPSSAKHIRTHELKSAPNLTEHPAYGHTSASESLVRLLKDEKLKVEKRDLMIIQLKQQLNETIKEKHKLKSILNSLEEYKQGFTSIEEILCTKNHSKALPNISSTMEINNNVATRATELISRALDITREISQLREEIATSSDLKKDLTEVIQVVEELKGEISQKHTEILQLEEARNQLQQIINVTKFDSFSQTENVELYLSTEDYTQLCQCIREFLEVTTSASDLNTEGFHEILTNLQNALSETKAKLSHFDSMEAQLNRTIVENRANRETIARLAADIQKFDDERAQHQNEMTSWREEINKIAVTSKCYQAEIISLKHQIEESNTERNMLENRLIEEEKKCEVSSLELPKLQQTIEELQLKVEFYQTATDPLFPTDAKDDNNIKSAILALQNELLTSQSELRDLALNLNKKNILLDQYTCEINVSKAAIQNLKIKNESFTREVYVLDSEKNRFLANEAQISQFYEQLGRAMQIDPDLNFVLEGDIAKDTLILRAEQLSKNESDKITEKSLIITSLRAKLKLSQQQLSNKELHFEILAKKYSSIENKLSESQLKNEENKKLNENNQKIAKEALQLRKQVLHHRKVMQALKDELEKTDSIRQTSNSQSITLAKLQQQLNETNSSKKRLQQQLSKAMKEVSAITPYMEVKALRVTETADTAPAQDPVTMFEDSGNIKRELEEANSKVEETANFLEEEKLRNYTLQKQVNNIASLLEIDNLGCENSQKLSMYEKIISMIHELVEDKKIQKGATRALRESIIDMENQFKQRVCHTLAFIGGDDNNQHCTTSYDAEL